ncbi:unnamed protein product [Trichobilharzia regenti]|nr:unnamed protein product [Trichobilharzia regenti]
MAVTLTRCDSSILLAEKRLDLAATLGTCSHSVKSSPSGKLVQIEYALKAVESGAPSVGIRAANGVVLAAVKKFTSKLMDESTVSKIEQVTDGIGMVYSGLSPDYRVLVKQARKSSQAYQLAYGEPISPEQLVIRIAAVMQEYTQSGLVYPILFHSKISL